MCVIFLPTTCSFCHYWIFEGLPYSTLGMTWGLMRPWIDLKIFVFSTSSITVLCRESVLNMYWMNYCELISQSYKLFCVFPKRCSIIAVFPLVNFFIFPLFLPLILTWMYVISLYIFPLPYCSRNPSEDGGSNRRAWIILFGTVEIVIRIHISSTAVSKTQRSIKVTPIWNMALREEIGMEISRVNCWSFSGENITCLR